MPSQYLSSLRFIRGKLLSLYETVFHVSPSTVNSEHVGYTFVGKTDAINFRNASHAGVYEDVSHRKFFIKDYAYTYADLDYEYLHNELTTLSILNACIPKDFPIRVPTLVTGEDRNNRITIITELIDGLTLDHGHPPQIEKSLIRVISGLRDIVKYIPDEELAKIPIRTNFHIYSTSGLYFARAFFKERSEWKLMVESFMYFLRYLPVCIGQRVDYTLSHRDLSVDNIMSDKEGKQVYVLDTECMVRADNLLDTALIPRLAVRYLTADQMMSIFHALHLERKETIRLTVLMILVCIRKIATETKGHRDYINAVKGLALVMHVLSKKLLNDI